MMRFATTVVFVLAVCLVGVASAQTPYIAAFFGPNVEQATYEATCPGFGTLDTMKVYLFNANKFVSGVDFSIDYGNNVSWILDMDPTGSVVFGATPSGFSMGWNIPQNGFFPIRIVNPLIQWVCQGCVFVNDPIVVQANPLTADLAFTDFPAFDLYPATGLTALTCPTVANEETTWGQIKSLYED
jgi:hypothetical protein